MLKIKYRKYCKSCGKKVYITYGLMYRLSVYNIGRFIFFFLCKRCSNHLFIEKMSTEADIRSNIIYDECKIINNNK